MDKEKRNARQARYMENKERLSFIMEKGTKKRIAAAADAAGISQGEFIREAIEDKLQADQNGGRPDEIERLPFTD